MTTVADSQTEVNGDNDARGSESIKTVAVVLDVQPFPVDEYATVFEPGFKSCGTKKFPETPFPLNVPPKGVADKATGDAFSHNGELILKLNCGGETHSPTTESVAEQLLFERV